MHLKTRNVNTAFRELVGLLQDANKFHKPWTCDGIPVAKKSSRNGPVIMIEEPVTISYSHPKERVLFNVTRDANPFFHLYEAMWMLAGRDDVAPLAYYASNVTNYSDDGKTLNGAYGRRWRMADVKYGSGNIGWKSTDPGNPFPGEEVAYPTKLDQLDLLVNHLKTDPNSRRAVLQMWNVEDDLLKIGGGECIHCDGGGMDGRPLRNAGPCNGCGGTGIDKGSKDVCCNLSVMFSIRETKRENTDPDAGQTKPIWLRDKHLDMTVTNRSNDLIWGMLGANYVHFTFLQEYMAARLGVEVGLYHHFTNNLHVYEDNWKPKEWLENAHIHDYGFHIGSGAKPEYSYPNGESNRFIPLVKDPTAFEKEVAEFVEAHKGPDEPPVIGTSWEEPFLRLVASPMLRAFHQHKRRNDVAALNWAKLIEADDWRIAATNWLEKRRKAK